MMDSLLNTIMKRDELTREDALALIDEAKQAVVDGEDPEEVLLDHFGLEPDYIFDLLD
jgi:hypothetical protein